jgi:hypothetical protein
MQIVRTRRVIVNSETRGVPFEVVSVNRQFGYQQRSGEYSCLESGARGQGAMLSLGEQEWV